MGLIAGSLTGQSVAMTLIDGMSKGQFGEPSLLPGWTRAHVVAHLIGNTLAQTRQVDYALRGELVEVYTGGQEARAADIEERAVLAPSDLVAQLRDAHASWEAAVVRLDASSMAAPVEYRSGTVADVVAGRWMECLVHAVDLGVPSYSCRSWPAGFCRVLLGYLLVRLPARQRVRLEAIDADYDITVGEPDENYADLAPKAHSAHQVPDLRSFVHLRGRIADIAGFLSDRGPAEALESLADPLGPLGPYPRGSIR